MTPFFKGFFEELVKLSMHDHDGWDIIDHGQVYSPTPDPGVTGSPLMHEQAVPDDVTDKSIRGDYFKDIRQSPPQSSGKIKDGKLGTHGTRR